MCLGLGNGYREPKETEAEEVVKTLQKILEMGDQPVGDGFFVNITSKTVKDAIDLINEQQRQLDNYSHNVGTMVKSIRENQVLIDELVGVCQTMKQNITKKFANDIINDLLPKIMVGHEEKALELSLAISNKIQEMEAGTNECS